MRWRRLRPWLEQTLKTTSPDRAHACLDGVEMLIDLTCGAVRRPVGAIPKVVDLLQRVSLEQPAEMAGVVVHLQLILSRAPSRKATAHSSH